MTRRQKFLSQIIGQLRRCNVLSEAEKYAFKITIIDLRDRASFFVKENQVHKNELNNGIMGMGVKVISETEKNEKESRRPSPHEYRKCRELRTIRLPTTKRRIRNRNPLKRDVYRIEGNSCIFAEKFSFLRQ